MRAVFRQLTWLESAQQPGPQRLFVAMDMIAVPPPVLQAIPTGHTVTLDHPLHTCRNTPILVDEWGVQRDSDGRYVYFFLATVGGSDCGAPVCESRAHGPARAGGSPAGAGSQPSGVRRRQSGRESEMAGRNAPRRVRAIGRKI
jgi:hypothetical protein